MASHGDMDKMIAIDAMVGMDLSDDEELKNEIVTILQVIPSDWLKSHLIRGSIDVSGLPEIQGTILQHRHKK
jgi:hypothetical protein